ncbi:MAG TPA: MBL fold metallo-hydrolase [bacterium]
MKHKGMASTHSLRIRIIRSGSSGNAIFLEGGGTRLIVDVGLPAEVVTRELAPMPDATPIDAILLTHEHEDHAKGAGVLSRTLGAPVLANEGTLSAAAAILNGAERERFATGVPFRVGELEVEAFPVPHDAVEPVGFVISSGLIRVLIATDLGAADAQLAARAKGVDVLILEANYDLRLLSVSPYPWFLKNRILSPTGHLSNDAAARVVVEAASDHLQTVFLVHLSDINNLTPLARDTVQWALQREGLGAVRVEAVRPNGTMPLWSHAEGITTELQG